MPKKRTTDDAVMELLMRVQKKKEAIKVAKKTPRWKTNCSIAFDSFHVIDFGRDTAHKRINIQVEKNPRVLMELYGNLIHLTERLELAAKELDLPSDLTYMAYPICDWVEDITTRAAQLSIDGKQKEVDALDKRVNSLISPDQRREMELQALQQLLGE